MSPNLKKKLELIIVGYGFLFLNIYATSLGYAIVGIGFGLVAGVFFIQARRIKK